MANRRRCAVVGIGNRAHSWISAVAKTYTAEAELVALCDPAEVRCHDANQFYGTRAAVFADYGRMLAEARPELVIVVSPDWLHADHIVRALEAGCQVATEKPLCTTGADAQRILEAERKAGRPVFMGFNYRLIPLNLKLKELLVNEAIGEPVSMDLTWYLDYHGHGLSYFRRWHREMKYSGGLLITKGTHHLDLANWLMGDAPRTVFARCTRNFFGPGKNPFHGTRCSACEHAKQCRFYTDINVKPTDFEKLSLELGYRVTGVRDYIRDYCPFGPEVDIYDTHSLVVEYRRGGFLNYSLCAGSPFEGWNLAINGRTGRLETQITDAKPARGWQKRHKIMTPEDKLLDKPGYRIVDWPADYSIFVMPHEGNAYEVDVPNVAEGHGGGDFKLFDGVFRSATPPDDPLCQFARVRDGAFSVGIGDAANRSAASGKPVTMAEVLGPWAAA
jgi:predicted dehydrogenase